MADANCRRTPALEFHRIFTDRELQLICASLPDHMRFSARLGPFTQTGDLAQAAFRLGRSRAGELFCGGSSKTERYAKEFRGCRGLRSRSLNDDQEA